MRFDTPVYFQTITKGAYNADTGNYEPDTVTEVKKFASVTDSGINTLNLIYGTIKEGCKTIRLQNIYRAPFNRVRIGEKTYRVDFQRLLRCKHILVCSEVQNAKN